MRLFVWTEEEGGKRWERQVWGKCIKCSLWNLEFEKKEFKHFYTSLIFK